MNKKIISMPAAFLFSLIQSDASAANKECLIEQSRYPNPSTFCNANAMNLLYDVKNRFELTPNGCVKKMENAGGWWYKPQAEYYGTEVHPVCTDDDVLGSMSEG